MKKCLNRKLISILLICLMLSLTPAMAMANSVNDSENEIMPRLTYIVDAMTALDISNGTATVDCWVKGNYGEATKAKVIAELQLKSGSSWMAYGTWTDTQNDYEAYVYKTKSVKSGQTYRVKATYTVWEGSQSETIVVYTDEVTA